MTDRRTAAWVGAILLWLVLGFRMPSEWSSYGAGQLMGTWLFTLAVAAVLRFLYVLARRRRETFLSPWLFVIAAAIGLVLLVARAGEQLQRQAEAASLVEATPGARNENVVECVEGGIERYEQEEDEAAAMAKIGITENKFQTLLVRACRRVDAEFDIEELEEDPRRDERLMAALERIVVDEVDRMRRNGELPQP